MAPVGCVVGGNLTGLEPRTHHSVADSPRLESELFRPSM
jgi:hypothetical protein